MTDITDRLRDPSTVRSWAEADAQRAEAADTIEALRRRIADLELHIHTCGPTCERAGCVNARLRDALTLIAAPMRPDGTWNRDRATCAKLARAALGLA